MKDQPLRLASPTGRNTRAHRLDIGEHSFYFSYETCIAYEGPHGRGMRLANYWGPTTGRHFREMGISHLPVQEDDQFNAVLRCALSGLLSGAGFIAPEEGGASC